MRPTVHVLSVVLVIMLSGISVTSDSDFKSSENDVQGYDRLPCNWTLNNVIRNGTYYSTCGEDITVEYLDSNNQDPQREWANPW